MTTYNNKTILITGGTGLIGKALAKNLKQKGYTLYLLSRSESTHNLFDKVFHWDIEKGEIDKSCLDDVGTIIHLAGAGIAEKRWTDERKKLIIDSRVKSVQLIYDVLKTKDTKPVMISASAIGYYGGQTVEKIFTETDPPAKDFLGESCRQWEEAVDQLKEVTSRVVKIRTGIVLSTEGGALPQLTMPVKMFIGTPLGSGRQHVPWIHIDDIVEVYVFAVEKSQILGVYNAVAQTHCTNRKLTKAIARTLGRPFWPIPVPGVILKLLLGEMSAAVLEGSPVSNKKLISAGFQFQFADLDKALQDLLKK